MYPRILAGSVIASAQVAVRRWSAADLPVHGCYEPALTVKTRRNCPVQ
jgi:hypothetical protein